MQKSPHKTTALFASIASIVLYVVGFVMVGSHNTGLSAGAFGLAIITYLISWIAGLIKTASVGRWGWFIGIFLLSPIAALIYGLAGPDTKKA